MTDVQSHPGSTSSSPVTRRSLVVGAAVAGLMATVQRRAATAQTDAADDEAAATPACVPALERTRPMRLRLSDGTTEIDFFSAGTETGTRLTYHGEFGDVDYAVPELQITRIPALGLVVSAQVAVAPDGFSKELSLLVPDVNPMADGSDPVIATIAIITTWQMNIAGPKAIQGPLQSFDVLELTGRAVIEPDGSG